MAVTAKALIQAKQASNSVTAEYTTGAATRAIIDKFTATNTDAAAQTITVYIVPPAGSYGSSNQIVKAKSINAGECVELTELKNQVLNPTESIQVVASVALAVVIRASGREVT